MLVATAALILALAPPPQEAAPVMKPTPDDLAAIRADLDGLARAVAAIRPAVKRDDHLADVEVYAKAADYALGFGDVADRAEVAAIRRAIEVGRARAEALGKGDPAWTKASGSIVRGHRSKVDGSIQPYAVEVPAGLDLAKPSRLDVVLHGRDDGLTEARFVRRHGSRSVPADQVWLTLHVFGRGNNAYRWAGEADVFEAIAAVGRNYSVDDNRVVLRGFSMGGAGAWQIGLRHPTPWSSVEAGAGFVDTFAHTGLDRASLPPWRLKALSIYEAADYALNAFDVPIVAYGGEDDPQLRASSRMVDALKGLGVTMKADGLITTAEGLDFRRIVGKGMGHRVDPPSAAIMRTFHDEHARVGRDLTPAKIRFVTYSLAANRAAWLSVERLVEHYRRTTVEATLADDVATIATANVAVLAVDRQVAETARIDGQELPLRPAAGGLLPKVYYARGAGGWSVVDHERSIVLIDGLDGAKNPWVHGPIDDAFNGPFLVVEPTRAAWNAGPAEAARRRRDDFVALWRRRMRGDVRVKRDVDVGDVDIATCHLVTFGDPGSNLVLAKVVSGLPIAWDKPTFTLGSSYDAARHLPALIAPNPLNRKRYVVINSGMTFTAADFKGSNALLFPRLGDWAVDRLDDGATSTVASGFFDERWRIGPAGRPRPSDTTGGSD